MTDVSALRVALIGAGRMGATHLAAAGELGISIAALCDRSADALSRLGEESRIPEERCFDDAAQMFSSGDAFDLVIVAATADAHRESVEMAVAAGTKMILCEKPMAPSLADSDAMIEACRKSGTRLAVNHQMRFMDQYTLVKQELDGGRFGGLASMNVVGGCFGLAMNGSHYFEAFHFLTGSEISEVSAWFSPEQLSNPRGENFFDQAGEIRCVSGAGQRLNMEIGSDQGHGMTVLYATQYGHIFVDEFEGECWATARKSENKNQPSSRYGMPWDRWQITFPPADNTQPTKCVLEALITDGDFPSAAAGRNVVAALAAAYKSFDNASTAVKLSNLGDYHDRRFPWA
jgi:predicted dehydrogenase